MLADQMVGRIEFIHNKSFIHRDIKPGMIIFFLANWLFNIREWKL